MTCLGASTKLHWSHSVWFWTITEDTIWSTSEATRRYCFAIFLPRKELHRKRLVLPIHSDSSFSSCSSEQRLPIGSPIQNFITRVQGIAEILYFFVHQLWSKVKITWNTLNCRSILLKNRLTKDTETGNVYMDICYDLNRQFYHQ